MGKGDSYAKYYEVTVSARRRPFAVRSLGLSHLAAKCNYYLFQHQHPKDRRFDAKNGRTLDSVVIVFISAGHGSFFSKPSGRVLVPANSVFVVFPGVSHSYRYDDATGWDEHWLEMEPASVLPLLKEAGISPEDPLKTFSGSSAIADAFRALIGEARGERPGSVFLVEAAAHRVVAEVISLWRMQKDRNNNRTLAAVERMRQCLVEDSRLAPNVSEATKISGMSPSRIRELFRQKFGLSPKRYQMRLRMQEAGRFLRDTDMPITDVAAEIGFSSVFTFSHRFKQEIGCSPLAYRQRLTGKKKGKQT